MSTELDEIYWLLRAAVDPSLASAAKQAQDTMRKTAEAGEASSKRVEKAIGEGTRRALLDVIKTAPQAAAAGKEAGEALGKSIGEGVLDSSARSVPIALARVRASLKERLDEMAADYRKELAYIESQAEKLGPDRTVALRDKASEDYQRNTLGALSSASKRGTISQTEFRELTRKLNAEVQKVFAETERIAAVGARKVGRKAGEALDEGMEQGIRAGQRRVLATAEQMIDELDRRFRLRMAKLEMGARTGRYSEERFNLLAAKATALHDAQLAARALALEQANGGKLADDDLLKFADAFKVKGKALGRGLGGGVTEGFSELIGGLASKLLAALSVGQLIAEVRKAFTAGWREADALAASQRRIAAEAADAGLSMQQLGANVRFVREQMQLTGGAAEELVASVGRLVRKAGEMEKLDAAAEALVNLGISRGLNLEEAVKAAGSAATGSAQAIEQLFGKSKEQLENEYRYRRNVIGSLNDQQHAQAVLDETMIQSGRASGALAAYLETQAGKSDEAAARQRELNAELGRTSPEVRDVSRSMGDAAKDGVRAFAMALAGAVGFGRDVLEVMGEIINSAPLLGSALRAIGRSKWWQGDGKPMDTADLMAANPFTSGFGTAMQYARDRRRPAPAPGAPLDPRSLGGLAGVQPAAPPDRYRGDVGAQIAARVAAMRQELEGRKGAEEAAMATARATNLEAGALASEAAARRVSNQHRRETNQLVQQHMRELRQMGAGTGAIGEIAAYAKPTDQGVAAQRNLAEAADAATEQLRIQAQQIRLLQKYWGDAATAPDALKKQVEDVTRIESQMEAARQQRLKLQRAGRDTSPADTVIADLEGQLEIAKKVMSAIAPLEAEFARGQAALAARRQSMTEAEYQEAGRALVQAYDEGITQASADNPRIAQALQARLKGALAPSEMAKSLVAEFTVALTRENTDSAVARLLGRGSPEQAGAAGAEAANRYVQALRERIAAAEGDPALREQLVKLLPQNFDVRQLGLDKITQDFFGDGQAESAIAAIAEVQEAVRGVTEAQQALALVEQDRDPATRAAAELRVAAAQAVVKQRVDAVRVALQGANLTEQQMAFVTERLAGALSSAAIPARDMAGSIGSLAGKVALVQGIADAFLTIAGSGASEEVREIVQGISQAAAALNILDAAKRAFRAKDLGSAVANGLGDARVDSGKVFKGGAGLGDSLAVLSGYAGIAGSLISLGSTILNSGERQRLAMIQQTIATLRNTDALEDFQRRAISNVSATERDSLLATGTAFAKSLEEAAPLFKVFDEAKLSKITAQQIEFLTKLEEITGASFFDASTGKLNYAEFMKAWQAFQAGDLGSFGKDAVGKMDAFEFLVQQLGDAAGDASARVHMLIEALRDADDLKGTRFADEFQKIFDEQGADAATKWLQELIKAFAAGGPDAAELVELFGRGLTAEEIQRILSGALSTVGEAGGVAGGGSNEQRVNVGSTEVQFNAALMQWATQTQLQGRMADTLDALYEAAVGHPPIRPTPIPVPTVAQVQAINGGGRGDTNVEIVIEECNFEFPGVTGRGAEGVVGAASAAGDALGESLAEKVAAALRGAGGTGRVRIAVKSGGLRS